MDDKDVEDKDDKARAGPDLTRFPVASPDGRALVDVHPRSLGDQYRARCRGMRSVPLAPVVHALDTVADPAACVVLDLHASGKAHWHFAVYEDSKGLMASGCIRLGGLERTHLRHGSARLPTPAAPGRPDRARSQRQRPRYAGAPTRPPIRTGFHTSWTPLTLSENLSSPRRRRLPRPLGQPEPRHQQRAGAPARPWPRQQPVHWPYVSP